MLAFAIRRILQTVPTVLAVVLVIFVLFSVVPGSIASSMGDDGRGPVDPRWWSACEGARPRRSRLRPVRQLRLEARHRAISAPRSAPASR